MIGATINAVQENGPHALDLKSSSILWQQTLSILPEPGVWVHAPEETWKTITTSILTSAGLDSVEEEDQRSTWAEVIQQSLAGFATALTADVRREITLKKGHDIAEAPQVPLRWLEIQFEYGDEQWRVSVAFAPNLVNVYDPAAFTEILEKPQKTSRTGVSQTFDLLLDVALPVSVSFGKTSLQLREVLKLNTGSIVELDRFVTEPVEVIVNDCVIARGDVVVVDGNYGVRIRQLASREDRLRSGFTDLAGVTARKP